MQLEGFLNTVRAARSEGRLRERPASLVASRGYSYGACQSLLRRRSVSYTTSERKDQK